MFRISIFSLLVCCTMLQAFTKFELYQQKKIIVYNVPQHKAIDFISANKYFFYGDSVLQQDGLLQNFHLKPARISIYN